MRTIIKYTTGVGSGWKTSRDAAWLSWRVMSSDSSTQAVLVQPLSDQNWVNRAFCGKSMKLGTDVHHTKPSKFSYSAKPDFPRGGFGGHLKKMAAIPPYLRN